MQQILRRTLIPRYDFNKVGVCIDGTKFTTLAILAKIRIIYIINTYMYIYIYIILIFAGIGSVVNLESSMQLRLRFPVSHCV